MCFETVPVSVFRNRSCYAETVFKAIVTQASASITS